MSICIDMACEYFKLRLRKSRFAGILLKMGKARPVLKHCVEEIWQNRWLYAETREAAMAAFAKTSMKSLRAPLRSVMASYCLFFSEGKCCKQVTSMGRAISRGYHALPRLSSSRRRPWPMPIMARPPARPCCQSPTCQSPSAIKLLPLRIGYYPAREDVVADNSVAA